jgi:dolichyl-diphosphooligosaccharide--protein glycosyltransferase
MTWFFFLFLIIWALVGFFALNRGSRFILIIIPPFVLITGILVGIWTEYFKSLKNIKNYPIFQKKNVITYLSLALVIIVASISISNAFLDVSFIPIVNDDLDDAARWINGNTPINTVVISEWSYGHLLTANSNRSVIFDGRLGYVETLPIRNFDKSFKYGGSSPGVLRWYWFNKAFSTDNENLSKGIFSMLTSTGDEASMVLNQYSHNTTLTVEILNKILSENKEDAKNILINDYGMPGEQADNIIKYSHPDSHPPYVVMTTEEMKNNGFWIFYFGGWNFENNKSEEFSFRTGTLNQSADFINTTNGININLKTDNFTFNEEEPYAVFTISDGNVKKNFFNNTNDKVIVLLTDEEKWVVIDKKYQNSLFYKLLLVQQDTETFKIVYKNNKVIIWNNLQSIKG